MGQKGLPFLYINYNIYGFLHAMFKSVLNTYTIELAFQIRAVKMASRVYELVYKDRIPKSLRIFHL